MTRDFDMIKTFYQYLDEKVTSARNALKRPLTLAEKLMYAHCTSKIESEAIYANFRPDRVAMQDATAQMAVLQFMNAGKDTTAVPTTIHCDHLVRAEKGACADLQQAKNENAEVYDFLKSAATRYGMGFWEPGSGIIHQIVLENYAFPGGMMVGTDSHTPNAGGLGMMAIGVGGADAVDVMCGMDWELRIPKRIGVHLKGQLNGWTSAKDIILHLLGVLTVKGGTNSVVEYFGEGATSLSCTGKATLCNMGAELGATTSVFPYDASMERYLIATGRANVAEAANAMKHCLKADDEVYQNPEAYFDRVIEIDLSTLSPYVNGPFTPDAAAPIQDMKARLAQEGYPVEVDVALIGSCTNSSYQDLARAASVVKQALALGLKPKSKIIINPGSNLISETAKRDGILSVFDEAGALVMANACGPCIGQWKRITDDNTRRNTIVTSFNRNFAKRADGNPNTHAFITSPEMAMAFAFAGRLDFNPATDSIVHPETGEALRLPAPEGDELPLKGYADADLGYVAPDAQCKAEPIIQAGSQRLQKLERFAAWDGEDFKQLHLLIKTKGKCTTDHISMAGPWLRFRGHLENISENCLMGAVNAFNDKTNEVVVQTNGECATVHQAALQYRALGSVVVAEENYGEGSSREHAAMEPRFLGVKVILAKSFARIHETNLKKQGVLALTFSNAADYDKVEQADRISVNVSALAVGEPLKVTLHHADGSTHVVEAKHTYSAQQIEWFKAGSALNAMSLASKN